MIPIRAVLFDLDGTLIDTAEDLVFTLNKIRKQHGLDELSLATMRPKISLGSKEMIKYALGIAEDHPDFAETRKQFLDHYQNHLADSARVFPNMDIVLTYLEKRQIPWGIVTNKLTRHTLTLLKALHLDLRPVCIICGDTLTKYKPDPEPILHACELLQQAPKHCLYIGDSNTDVIASKAAGTQSLVALYGYIDQQEDPYAWLADGYIHNPIEILDWL